jgi:hypothetical protein
LSSSRTRPSAPAASCGTAPGIDLGPPADPEGPSMRRE